jgi:uncharacterized protein (TIGR02271 family)
MKKTQRTTAVGVFTDRQRAQEAVNELRRVGFREDQIGVAGRDGDRVTGAHTTGDTGSNVAVGAATGVATGAGLGALWGLGIVAGLLPAIGPAIAGGTLAAILSSAAAGAAAAGLVGALIGLGIPEEEATYYDTEFQAGRYIVTVNADGRYDEAVAIMRRYNAYDYSTRSTATTTHATAAECATGTHAQGAKVSTHSGKVVQAKEEKLHPHKEAVQTGEVKVRKEVHTEQKTMQVPVTKEEVVIERHAVSGRPTTGDIKAGEEIRIPVREEQVHLEKDTVVGEEVVVGKRKVQDSEQVTGTVRKEEIKVEKKGDVDVNDKRR